LMPRREPPLLDADAAAAAARAHAPGEVITAIQLPSRQRPAWTVMLRAEDSDPEFRVRSIITLDPWTGAVLEDRSPRSRSTAEEALALQRWLHGGAPLGMPGRLLVFLSGLTMPLLFVTGLSAWLLRRRNLRRLSLSARDAATAFPRRPA
ncbi:MAG: PepSY domain-containing protein, partial [Acetobacteraceae bacterium]|nr:PepSY domain-containing protein [Acetobacteraceae bacterium]